jgi:hypothetical protein
MTLPCHKPHDRGRWTRVFTLTTSDPTAPGPIGDAIRSFIEDRMVISEVVRGETLYRPADQRRTQLSFSQQHRGELDQRSPKGDRDVHPA